MRANGETFAYGGKGAILLGANCSNKRCSGWIALSVLCKNFTPLNRIIFLKRFFTSRLNSSRNTITESTIKNTSCPTSLKHQLSHEIQYNSTSIEND